MLLNVSTTKKYILEQIKAKRPGWNATQVSSSAIHNLNAKLMSLILKAIEHHPSATKTFDFDL